MKNTTELKEFAQLAQAAYAELIEPGIVKNKDKTKIALQGSKNSPFSEDQATDFTNRYEVLNQFRDFDGMLSGFSGTLFKDRDASNRYVLSFAGTEFETDKLRDLVTDSMIGVIGYAAPQLIALYRYVKQLQTPANQAVQYSESEISDLFAAGVNLKFPTRESLVTALSADKGIDAGQGGGNALMPSGARVDLAGHSLGGHLALLAQRLFPSVFGEVVTVNAPGFYAPPTAFTGSAPMLLAELNLSKFGFWNDSAITRIESVGDGISEIGTRFPGQAVTVGMETYSTPLAPISNNHSVANVADGLALTEAIGKLDARFATDARLAKPFFDAGANTPGMSYENLLDGLRKVILGAATPATTQDNTEVSQMSASRQPLYANLKTLTDTNTFKALAGKVTVSLPSTGLASSAKTDFGAFLSLQALSPIVLSIGNDAAATAALKAANPNLSTAWTADYNARLYGDSTKALDYSDNWYADRAAMLQAIVTRNEKDAASDAVVVDTKAPSGQFTFFHDAAFNGATPLMTAPHSGAGLQDRHIFFGGSGNDSFAGYDGIKGDHLYGGAGDDTVVDADGLGLLTYGGIKAFTLYLSVSAAANGASIAIAVDQMESSDKATFCFETEATSDGWMWRAA